jgi:hypothetical protein
MIDSTTVFLAVITINAGIGIATYCILDELEKIRKAIEKVHQ